MINYLKFINNRLSKNRSSQKKMRKNFFGITNKLQKVLLQLMFAILSWSNMIAT
jgi:hypothetical protein